MDDEIRHGLGGEGELDVDVETVEVEDGDVYLLATAGVARHLENGDVSVLAGADTVESMEEVARGILRGPGGDKQRGCACQVVRMRRRRKRRVEAGRSDGLRWAGATHCGLRSRNEDAMLLRAPAFALADGMGGMVDGALASRLAMDGVAGSPRVDEEGAREWLARVTRLADDAIGRRLNGEGGSTLDVLFVDGDGIHIAHVGDGRVLRIRGEHIEQVTEDHNVAARLSRQGLGGPMPIPMTDLIIRDERPGDAEGIESKIATIADMVDQAMARAPGPARDGLLGAALNKLRNDVLAKADGSIGGTSGNDWIVDPEAQTVVLALVEESSGALEAQLSAPSEAVVGNDPELAAPDIPLETLP